MGLYGSFVTAYGRYPGISVVEDDLYNTVRHNQRFVRLILLMLGFHHPHKLNIIREIRMCFKLLIYHNLYKSHQAHFSHTVPKKSGMAPSRRPIWTALKK